MENLLANFLFQYKYCPLPGIGTLVLSETEASYEYSEKSVSSPQAIIRLKNSELDPHPFEQYVSQVKSITEDEATRVINQFSEKLQNLDAYAELKVPCVGKFFVDADGQINFKQIPFPQYLRQPVHAEKVIRPDATHSILVGDKESNSAIMTEYYSTEPLKKKRTWQLAALLLFLLGLGTIAFYYFGEHRSGLYNTSKARLQEEPSTYTIPK